jgi:hypothetical protein
MNVIKYFAKNLFIVLGVVLVWRGVWYLLDAFDKIFFGGSHLWTAAGGILLGALFLYWPDKDLTELKKLKD